MTEEDVRRFRSSYWRAMRALDAVRFRQWERSHLTLPQIRVLHQLRRTPGLTTGDLARLLGVTVSTTSGLVNKLAQHGLIERSTDVNDHRQVSLYLTTVGQEQVGELADEGRELLGRMADSLGNDLWGVTVGLERLAEVADRARAMEPDPNDVEAVSIA